MPIEIVPDAQAIALRAADIVCDAVRANPEARLGLPTGGTPVATYAEIARRAAAGEADLSRATAYAIDEFAGVPRSTPGTNSAFYRKHVRFPLRALQCPNPAASDPEEHIRAFAAAIRRAGSLDLCLLGIGANGHIAFNEPPSAPDSRARVVDLAPSSRAAHAAAFGAIDRVPARGMTLGVADLLEARAIIMLAAGAAKAEIVARAVEGPVTAGVPASWLQTHLNVTWLLDEDAASHLRKPA